MLWNLDFAFLLALFQVRQKLLRLRVGPSFKRQFDRFDTNGDRRLSYPELVGALRKLHVELDSTELRHLFEVLDRNGDQEIT